MFTALSNWRFFPASSIRVFLLACTLAYGEGKTSFVFAFALCRETPSALDVCVHICSHHTSSSRRALALTKFIFTERRIFGVPKSFYYSCIASLSRCRRGSCRRFSFLCVVVSKALSKYFQKGHALGLGFKVTRGLARARRQRRAWTTTTPSYNTTMASSSSSRFVFRLLLRGRSKLSKPGRSIDR